MNIYPTNIYYYGSDGVPHTYKLNALLRADSFANKDGIKWDGVNGVSALIDSPAGGELRVFRTSGYTADRGLFIDTYKPNEWRKTK